MAEAVQPTEAEVEVTDEMIEAADQVIDQIDEARVNEEWDLTLDVIRAMLTAALAVSPLREQVQKLTEENERLRANLSPVYCPTCSHRFDPTGRCPLEKGLGRCMEKAGHPGWHWSDVGHSDGSVLIWTGDYVTWSCPGRLSTSNWCKLPAGHTGLHNNGRGCSFGEIETSPAALSPSYKGEANG